MPASLRKKWANARDTARQQGNDRSVSGVTTLDASGSASEKLTLSKISEDLQNFGVSALVRIPVKATMDSDAWRPLDPVDDDQGGA